MAQSTPHFERDSSNNGWTLTKPDPLSIGTDRPMALVVRPGGKGSTRTAWRASLAQATAPLFGCSQLLSWQPGSNSAVVACTGGPVIFSQEYDSSILNQDSLEFENLVLNLVLELFFQNCFFQNCCMLAWQPAQHIESCFATTSWVKKILNVEF